MDVSPQLLVDASANGSAATHASSVSAEPRAPSRTSENGRPYIGLALALLFAALVRLRAAGAPLERDEGEFAYGGQLLLQGVVPIEHLYAMKLPGIYAAYAFLMSIFGQSAWGVHVGALCVNLATIAFLFFLARRWFDTLTATIAAATYALLSVMPEILGLAAHATHFVAAFVLAGAFTLDKTLERAHGAVPSPARLGGGVWGSGLLFGLAILMKQPGAFFVPLGLLLLWRHDVAREPRAGRMLQFAYHASLFMVGAALPIAVTWGLLAVNGNLTRALFWNFTYAREYAALIPFAEGRALFMQRWNGASGPFKAFLFLGMAGITVIFWGDARARRNAPLVLGLLTLGALTVIPGLYFRPHYFVLVLPGVALGVGLFCAGAGRGTTVRIRQEGRRGALVTLVAVFAFAVPAVALTITQGRVVFLAPPDEISHTLYGRNPFPESTPIADYLRRHTRPNETIMVFGSEPQIYFLSRRRSASGHTYMYPLTEPQKYAYAMQAEMFREVTKSRPRYIVLVSCPPSWFSFTDGGDPALFKWVTQYRKAFYPVAIADQFQENGKFHTNYVWDADAARYKPKSSYFVAILRRRSDADSNGAGSSGANGAPNGAPPEETR